MTEAPRQRARSAGKALYDDHPPSTAVPFPSDDLVFAERVREAVRDIRPHPVADAMDEISQRLRPVHHEVHTRLVTDPNGWTRSGASFGAAD